MKKNIMLLLIGGLVLFCNTNLFAWASITAPSEGDKVTFSTNVENVEVFLNEKKIGRVKENDFSYRFRRDGIAKTLTFKKDGYYEKTLELKKSLVGVYWANVLIGGLFGSSTDSISTKNHMQYSPNQYFIEMKKI